MALFEERSFSDVTVKELAAAAHVFPNQITHHFGSKDALFVGSAFALLLRQSERLREAGHRATTPRALGEGLASTAMSMSALPVVVGAISVARGNPAVRPALHSALNVLFRQSAGYLDVTLRDRGWTALLGVDESVRVFWSAIFGAVLLSRAGSRRGPSGSDLADALPISLISGTGLSGTGLSGTGSPAA